MPSDPKQRPDLQTILATNPQLDQQKLAEMAAFRERMERAGFKVRPTYRVDPALGSINALVPPLPHRS